MKFVIVSYGISKDHRNWSTQKLLKQEIFLVLLLIYKRPYLHAIFFVEFIRSHGLKISNSFAIDRLFTAVKNKASSRLVLTMSLIELDGADQRYILPFLITRSKNVKLLTIDYQIPINWKDDIFSISRTSFEFVFSSFCQSLLLLWRGI